MDTIQTPDPGRRPRTYASRVLVVDDESRIRLALRACLEAEHYHVDEAADGFEALEAACTFYDAIILDLSMPRLTGQGVLTELCSKMGEAMPKVIVLTAYGSSPGALTLHDQGASAILEKPLLPDVLRRTMEQVLQPAATDS